MVKQEEVVNLLVNREGINQHEIFAKNWLEIDDCYRQAGWSVEYDKPGYNENYGAFWILKKKR